MAGIYDQFFSIRVGGKTPRLGSLIPYSFVFGHTLVRFQLFTFDRRWFWCGKTYYFVEKVDNFSCNLLRNVIFIGILSG